jgi:hypothetical protein
MNGFSTLKDLVVGQLPEHPRSYESGLRERRQILELLFLEKKRSWRGREGHIPNEVEGGPALLRKRAREEEMFYISLSVGIAHDAVMIILGVQVSSSQHCLCVEPVDKDEPRKKIDLGACSKISRPTYKSDGPPCP